MLLRPAEHSAGVRDRPVLVPGDFSFQSMDIVKISRHFVDRFWYKNISIIDSPPGIGSDPADVLAPSEAPVLERQSTQVQTITAPTPQKYKTSAAAHLKFKLKIIF